MKNKEKAKNYNALYRKQHFIAIAIKHRMYKKLSRVKERGKQNQKRKEYHKKYYQDRKEYFRTKSRQWVKQNPEGRKLILRRYAEKLRLRMHRRRASLRRSPKIQNLISEFMEYCKERYAKDTIRLYGASMERFSTYIHRPGTKCSEYHTRIYQEYKKLPEERDFSWTKEYCKIRLIKDIDRDLITSYVSYVNCDEINNTRRMKLSQSEKESRFYPLKAFLLYCQRKGHIKKDLRKFIIVPRREKKILKRVMTQEEMEKFLEAPDEKNTVGIRDRALLEISYSGFRANEMLTLKIGHVDLVTNAVTILNAKGDKDRVVPMTNEAIYWIRRWLNRRNEFIDNRQNPEYLFITKGTKRIIRRNFSSLIKKYAKRANIPIDISPHDLRRTTATHLVENGAPIRLIQALLGHATLKVTTKYLRLSDEKIKKEHKQTHPSNRRSLYYGKLQG